MADMNDDEDHALSDFLRTRLEHVGLDYETYGPYVFPLLTDSEADPEEWDSVLELLQASSESHSDDDATWSTLRADIQAAWAAHQQSVLAQEEKEQEARQQQLSEALAEEKRLAELAAMEQKQAAADKQSKAPSDDAAKRALLDRFGYEDPDAVEGEGDNGGGAVTNQQIAAQAAQDKQQEMRSNKGATKKDEQAKTAQAKMEKARLKEERRKKTARGERRRG